MRNRTREIQFSIQNVGRLPNQSICRKKDEQTHLDERIKYNETIYVGKETINDLGIKRAHFITITELSIETQ